MLSVGIDFGTSNSSVAVYDGQSVSLLPLDPAAPNPRVMRSLIYIERSGQIWYGQTALDRYLEQNTGRAVRYEMRRVGQVEMVFAEVGTLVKDAYALIDVNEPGRLFQSLKRFLTARVGIGAPSPSAPFVQEAAAATSFQTTNVFGMNFRIEELLSLLAREIVRLTEAALGSPISRLAIGWPVRFSEDAVADALARDRLREAWRLATPADVRFVEEPVAAIVHFASATEVSRREQAVVFDFGGGTLDICVARLTGGAVEVLSTAGIALGGDLIDGRIVETRLTSYFGESARFKATGLPMPRYIFNRLRAWQTLIELNRPEHMSLIAKAKQATDQPQQIAALEALIAKNYGLAFFQAVERAKVGLSSHEEAEVRLMNNDIQLAHVLPRESFEATIAPQVRDAKACVETALASADVEPEEVGLVLTTGGSSLIPAFRQMLRESFPNASLQASDAFTSVAAGLAVGGFSDKA